MGRKKKSSNEEILVKMVLHSDPVVTTTELAEVTPYQSDGVRKRLKEMEDVGYVKSKKVGSRATVWWITESGRQQLVAEDY